MIKGLDSMTPADHHGTHYTEVMKQLCKIRRPKTYLEVGVNTGNLLQHISSELAICVDPQFVFNVNFMNGINKAHLYQQTSDEFFASDEAKIYEGKVDIAFLDGMHVFEYLLRDFYNTERLCNRRSVIIMHDCLPLNSEMAHRNFAHSLSIGKNSSHPDYWTGDVWKIIPILKRKRPDLKIIYLDAAPTGLVLVTNLDPTSTVLEEHYLEIVEEHAAAPNDIDSINKMYETINLTSAQRLLNDFDHSLLLKA